MLDSLLLKGALIGFSIAMPVGPIGMLCIRNSLNGGVRYGFMTGLGAAAADSLYGAIAGFGLAGLMAFMINFAYIFKVAGGLFLCYLGVMSFISKKSGDNEIKATDNILKVFGTTFFLTLTNPMTILSFIAIYAGFGIGADGNSILEAAMVTLGVFIGSALWWLLLSGGTALFRAKLSQTFSLWINRISGTILIGFGLAACTLL